MQNADFLARCRSIQRMYVCMPLCTLYINMRTRPHTKYDNARRCEGKSPDYNVVTDSGGPTCGVGRTYIKLRTSMEMYGACTIVHTYNVLYVVDRSV